VIAVGAADHVAAQSVELLDALASGLTDPFDQRRHHDLDEGDAADHRVER
jgi:hypothetical protein